jgi:hypothetical protein
MSGSALFLNKAVVNDPSPRNPGKNVPVTEPRMRGTSIMPPGSRCSQSTMGTCFILFLLGYRLSVCQPGLA